MHAAGPFRRKHFLKLWMAVGIALSTAFFLSVASPARAESGTGLPHGAGHTCKDIGDDGIDDAVVCLDLGIYTTSAGAQYVTAQVEAICKSDSDGSLGPCLAAQAEATIAAPGWTDWTTKSCNNTPCDVYGPTTRSYLFPFGGLSISPGYCYNEVWASIMGAISFTPPTWLQLADTYNWTEKLTANFATPHYKICESDSGVFTWTG